MSAIELSKGIWWVGVVDWDLREFHGLAADRGSSYNAYLVVDEKVALIDAVRSDLTGALLDNIASVIDPSRIDYVISNHAEPDHSSGLPAVIEACGAPLLATPNGVKRLKEMYRRDWRFRPVADGEELPLGSRGLRFIHAPLLHWPETMFTHDAESSTLFSCDAFGAHLATTERFTDQLGVETVLEYTRQYYAFLVAPFRKSVLSALAKAGERPVSVIAPSHGPVWRQQADRVMAAYYDWASLRYEDRAVIIYASMWDSTRKMAYAIAEGVRQEGLEARVFDLERSVPSDIISACFLSRLTLLGSPTFVGGIYPPVEAFLAWLKVPRDYGRRMGCFGSYGWSSGAVKKLIAALGAEGYPVMEEGLALQFAPTDDGIRECVGFGRQAARWALEK